MREAQVWSLGQEDPWRREMATHSGILAWRIPWTVLQATTHGVAESTTTKWLLLFTTSFMYRPVPRRHLSFQSSVLSHFVNTICGLPTAWSPGESPCLTAEAPAILPHPCLPAILSSLPTGSTLGTCLLMPLFTLFTWLSCPSPLSPTNKCPLTHQDPNATTLGESDPLGSCSVLWTPVFYHSRWEDWRLSSQTDLTWDPGSSALLPNSPESLSHVHSSVTICLRVIGTGDKMGEMC